MLHWKECNILLKTQFKTNDKLYIPFRIDEKHKKCGEFKFEKRIKL